MLKLLLSLITWPFRLAGGLLASVLVLLCMTMGVLTILGLWGADLFKQSQWAWVFDLFSHFQVQYFWVQLACVVGFVILRNKLWLPLALIFLSLNLWQIVPYYSGKPSEINTAPKVTILAVNVFGYLNQDAAPLAQLIQAKKPMLLCVYEYTPGYQALLEQSGVLKSYPYRVVGKSHIALYSKLPLRHSRLTYTDTLNPIANDATIQTQFTLGNTKTTLLVSHPPLPLMQYYDRQKTHFKKWINDPKINKQSLVIVGDLNVTPWSAHFEQLITGLELKDTQRGFGIQPTWPKRFSPIPLIPIDHVLVSKNFVVLKREVGPDVGSDHLPVYVELGLKK